SSDLAPVTQVIVDPVILSIKQGRKHQLKAFVRSNDDVKRTVVWDVVGTGTTTVSSGTSIDDDGVLTIGEDQLGELKVTATVTYRSEEFEEDGETPIMKDVVGESIVTVAPAI